MMTEAVVAAVDGDLLSTMLPAIHRNGLGHVARVLRPARASISDQLRRAGIPVEQRPAGIDSASAVLLITAAARSPLAADLLLRHGALRTWIVAPTGAWREIDDRAVAAPTPAQPMPADEIASQQPASIAATLPEQAGSSPSDEPAR